MRGLPAEAQTTLSDFGSILPKLWDIALDRAEHDDVSAYFLFEWAAVVLDGEDPFTRAIFGPAIIRAYEHQNRSELSRELLKLIRYIQGGNAIYKELERADEMDAFSRRHVSVLDDHFAMVWNRPGTEHLDPHDRAKRLLKELGSSSAENALRRVRRMVNRGWEMTGYHIGPGGRARQVR